MDLVCENGTIRIDFDRGVEIGQGACWTPIAASHDPAGWMLRAVEGEWRAMAATLRDGAAVPVDGHYGRAVIATITAAAEAARLRREIAPA
jgi:predicted dehydrogenase